MTRQAVVVRRKMDMPTAVVAMLGMELLSLPSEWTLGPSEEPRWGSLGKCAGRNGCFLCARNFNSSKKATLAFFSSTNVKICCICISNGTPYGPRILL